MGTEVLGAEAVLGTALKHPTPPLPSMSTFLRLEELCPVNKAGGTLGFPGVLGRKFPLQRHEMRLPIQKFKDILSFPIPLRLWLT